METQPATAQSALFSPTSAMPFGLQTVESEKTALCITTSNVKNDTLMASQPSRTDPIQSGLQMILQTVIAVINQFLQMFLQNTFSGSANRQASPLSSAQQAPQLQGSGGALTSATNDATDNSPPLTSANYVETADPTIAGLSAVSAGTAADPIVSLADLLGTIGGICGNVSQLIKSTVNILKTTMESRSKKYQTALGSAKKSINSLKARVKKTQIQ